MPDDGESLGGVDPVLARERHAQKEDAKIGVTLLPHLLPLNDNKFVEPVRLAKVRKLCIHDIGRVKAVDEDGAARTNAEALLLRSARHVDVFAVAGG